MQNIFFINTEDEYSFIKHYKPLLEKIPKEYRSMAISDYNGDQSNINSILDDVSSTSLSSTPLRIITIKNYDKLAAKKEFLTLLKSVDSNTFLFLQKDAPKTPPQLMDFLKNNRNKIIEINLYSLDHNSLVRRISEYLKDRGFTYEKQAVEKYASVFEHQEDLLLAELQKLEIYMEGSSKHFDELVLKDMLSFSPQFDIFETVKLFFSKNKKKSLLHTYSFIKQSPFDFVGLQSLLVKEAKKIILFKEYQKQGLKQEDIFKQMKISYPPFQQSLIHLSENFTLNETTQIADHLYEVELFLKTSSLQQKTDESQFNLKAYQKLLKIICFIGRN